jgi:hypothetical protein
MRYYYNRIHSMFCAASTEIIARGLLVQKVQARSYGLLLIQKTRMQMDSSEKRSKPRLDESRKPVQGRRVFFEVLE